MRVHIILLLILCGSFLIGNCKCGGDTGISVEAIPPPESIIEGNIEIPQDVREVVPRSKETNRQIEEEKLRQTKVLDSLIRKTIYSDRDCEWIYNEFLLAYREASEGKKERLKNIKWEDPVVSYCMDKYKSRFDSLEILFPEK